MVKNEVVNGNILKIATVTMLLAACHTPCTWDRQCPLDRVCCKDGYCTTNCKYDASICGSGEVCVDGTCQTACFSNNDCPSNYCSNGVCSIKPATDTTVSHNTDTGQDSNSDDSGNNSGSSDNNSSSDNNGDENASGDSTSDSQ